MVALLFFLIGILLSAFLGAWGGAEGTGKKWRRIGVSAATLVSALFILPHFWYILLAGRYFPLTIGYGIPGPNDAGSSLARFWFRIFDDTDLTRVFVRASIGLMVGLGSMIIPCIAGSTLIWVLWAVALSLHVMNHVCFGALVENEGTIIIFGKKLLREEAYIHGLDTALILGQILICKFLAI